MWALLYPILEIKIVILPLGYPKYRIPSLEPLRITSIEVGSGSGGKQIGLSLKMANIEIWGIQNANFYKSKMDVPNRTLELLWSSSRVEILGDYIMDGKVLVLPIKSDGPGNITLSKFKRKESRYSNM